MIEFASMFSTNFIIRKNLFFLFKKLKIIFRAWAITIFRSGIVTLDYKSHKVWDLNSSAVRAVVRKAKDPLARVSQAYFVTFRYEFLHNACVIIKTLQNRPADSATCTLHIFLVGKYRLLAIICWIIWKMEGSHRYTSDDCYARCVWVLCLSLLCTCTPVYYLYYIYE